MHIDCDVSCVCVVKRLELQNNELVELQNGVFHDLSNLQVLFNICAKVALPTRGKQRCATAAVHQLSGSGVGHGFRGITLGIIEEHTRHDQ